MLVSGYLDARYWILDSSLLNNIKARNPKHEANSNDQSTKFKEITLSTFNIGILDLYRISIFDFRICLVSFCSLQYI